MQNYCAIEMIKAFLIFALNNSRTTNFFFPQKLLSVLGPDVFQIFVHRNFVLF